MKNSRRKRNARAAIMASGERLLAVRNDLGLLSEGYDPTAKRLIGNFPQAFSHIALINSAYNLDRAAKPAEQRSGAKAPETDEDQSVLF